MIGSRYSWLPVMASNKIAIQAATDDESQIRTFVQGLQTCLTLWRPLLPYIGTAIKHPLLPDRVKPHL